MTIEFSSPLDNFSGAIRCPSILFIEENSKKKSTTRKNSNTKNKNLIPENKNGNMNATINNPINPNRI